MSVHTWAQSPDAELSNTCFARTPFNFFVWHSAIVSHRKRVLGGCFAFLSLILNQVSVINKTLYNQRTKNAKQTNKAGPDLGGGGGGGVPGFRNPPPPPLPYACTFSKRNKTKKTAPWPARGPMRPPGPPAEPPLWLTWSGPAKEENFCYLLHTPHSKTAAATTTSKQTDTKKSNELKWKYTESQYYTHEHKSAQTHRWRQIQDRQTAGLPDPPPSRQCLTRLWAKLCLPTREEDKIHVKWRRQYRFALYLLEAMCNWTSTYSHNKSLQGSFLT